MLSTFRLASLNILHGEPTIGDRIPLIIDELHRLQPDAVLLQEVEVLDDSTVDRIAKASGYRGVQHSFEDTGRGFSSGTAILSRAPLDSVHTIQNVSAAGQRFTNPPFTAVTITEHGHRFHLISAHLTWGADNERGRLAQAKLIDAHARQMKEDDPDVTILWGGDFNSVPEAAVHQFLSGHTVEDGESAFWVDAFDVAGDPADTLTGRNNTELAWASARFVGISHPQLVPARRLDYLKAHGWVYGRTGHPIRFGRWGLSESPSGLSVSDHYGIWADFLLA